MEVKEITPERIAYLNNFLRSLGEEQRLNKKQWIEERIKNADMPWLTNEWNAQIEIINNIETEKLNSNG